MEGEPDTGQGGEDRLLQGMQREAAPLSEPEEERQALKEENLRLSSRLERASGYVDRAVADLRKHTDLCVSLGDNGTASAFKNVADDLDKAFLANVPGEKT